MVSIAALCAGDKPPAAPLVFNSWPPKHKSQSLRHQLRSQLRTTGRLPQVMMLKRYPQRFIRPMKLQAMPHFIMKKYPSPMYFKPTLSTPSRIPFRSSPPGPRPNEYIYEKPYMTAATQKVCWRVTPEQWHWDSPPNLSISNNVQCNGWNQNVVSEHKPERSKAREAWSHSYDTGAKPIVFRWPKSRSRSRR